MSIKVYRKPPREGGPQGFTFPIAEAKLEEEETVDELKMRAALTRFAKRLLKQNTVTMNSEIIGVKIHSIGITFILGDPVRSTGDQR